MAAAVTAVALVGPRGAGKTTVGRELAVLLGWAFVDGDALIGDATGTAAGLLLAAAGEARFRELEERLSLPAIASAARAVVALGGGAVLSPAVRAALIRPGLFVALLWAPPAVLAARVAASPVPRPKLTPLPAAAEAAAVLAARLPLYRQVATANWDTGAATAVEIARAIAARVRPAP